MLSLMSSSYTRIRPLDYLLQSAVAYGLKRLNTNYSGAILNLRRASDNATKDFYADNWDNLDMAAVADFLSGTVGYVTTLYDQSCNSTQLNAVQTAASYQPRFFINSSGNPDMFFGTYNGTLRRLTVEDNARINFTTKMTCLSVFRRSSFSSGAPFVYSKHIEGASGYELHLSPSGNNIGIRFLIHSGGSARYVDSNTKFLSDKDVCVANVFDGSLPRMKNYINGTKDITEYTPPVNSIPTTTQPLYLGIRSEIVSYPLDGYISAFVAFNEVLTDEQIKDLSCGIGVMR